MAVRRIIALALAVPLRHGLRGVASHHFSCVLLRRLRHALHGVASDHFAATIVTISMDNGDMTRSLYVRASYYHTICQSMCFNGCASVLLLHLLALLLATVDVLWFHAC